ncbi:phosphoadenosine phosphosulfate reductase domain-containing protein [Neisseria sp. P0009.S001]|uniref:phosphoadenosine phosphosulfate reductase domain-containing protein n=1 Tax=unclassified Neisseria TaxID=2623750 RepID=UPI00114CCFB0|nr:MULTISPECIES: phosphoadenosine phosphosulfate reductase family protein [unclassified Neisseria]
MDKEPLLISFSGGRTSAYMTHLIMNNLGLFTNYTPFIVFANTGCEHEQTLEFIHQCETVFGWPVVWLEAVINSEHGKGTRHKVVNFEIASRNGEPYQAMIAKYTIPNVSNPHCTRELKLAVINSWAREKFGTAAVDTAIGIRVDESRRIKADAVQRKIIYPLVDIWPSEKQDVLDFWKKQPFDLNIPEYLGNCVWCFKKSDAKLLNALNDASEYFEFPKMMERLYPNGRDGSPVFFFRRHRTVSDLEKLKEIVEPTVSYTHQGGCSESCEFLQAV